MGFDHKLVSHLMLCNQTIGGIRYRLNGPMIRKKYKPADKGFLDKMQERALSNSVLSYLCFKTPFFSVVKNTAKTIKDVKRYFRMRK
jgi:hypothetical protein